MAPHYKTTFSQHVKDGAIHVEVGRDIAIPDGSWCCINCKKKDSKFPQSRNIALPPRISARKASWLKFEVTNSGEMIYARAHSLSIPADSRPYATPLDTWSALQAGFFASSKAVRSWMLYINKKTGGRDHYLCNFATWLMRQPSDTIEMAIAALKEIGADEETMAYIATCRAEEAARRSQRAANASKKAAETRAATAAKGENPKRWKEGDMVVSLTPQHFKSGAVHQVFFWVRSSYNTLQPAGCFLRVDENGLGVGARYRARKSVLLKVCNAAFDRVEGISNHEKLRLLSAQRRIEAEREVRRETEPETEPEAEMEAARK